MPELPEVEVVRRGLADHVVGQTITRAVVTGHRVARRHLAGPQDLADRLTGRRVEAACRRGKYLWLELDGDEALIAHLGMSGQMLVERAEAPLEKHAHAVFDLDAPGNRQLRFVDQRTFGGLQLDDLVPDRFAAPARPLEGGRQGGAAVVTSIHRHDDAVDSAVEADVRRIPSRVAHIAPDPLERCFDQQEVARRMKRRSTEIKRALLDQSLVSGIGNIYADEALWRAQVHGRRRTDALTKPAMSRVLDQAREVMLSALDAGGTSFDALYVNVNGASGYFDRSLNAYGQRGRPCPRCRTLIRREAFMNRSSSYCPRCQPAPRIRVR